MSEDTFGTWAVLELMGHRRLTGYVTEQQIGGVAFVRLDVPGPTPDEPPSATQFYSASAIYCLTPTTEAIARAMRTQPEPIQRWELPAPEPARAHPDVDAGDDETDDYPF